MQTEKLNAQDLYSGLLKQGKANKKESLAQESDFTRMLKFSVSGDKILENGDVSLLSLKRAAASVFMPQKDNNDIVRAVKTNPAKKVAAKNAALSDDDRAAAVKNSDAGRGAEKKTPDDDDASPTVKNEKAGDTTPSGRKTAAKDKDGDKEDKILVEGNENVVFSPVICKQDIKTDGELDAEVIPEAIPTADGEKNVSPFEGLTADNDNALFPATGGSDMPTAVTGGAEKTDFTSGLDSADKTADTAIFSRFMTKDDFKAAVKNAPAAANDNQDLSVANDVEMTAADIGNMINAAGKGGKDAKKHDVSAVADMQAKNISAIIGGNESVVITVGKAAQSNKKDDIGTLSNAFFPVICENTDGEAEIISAPNTLMPAAKITGAENGLPFAETDVSPDILAGGGQKVFSDGMSANASLFANLLNSETVSADDGELNISGVSLSSSYTDNAKMTSSFKHAKETTDVKPDVNIDDITDQIKIKVAKLKVGDNTVSIKLKPQELGEIQVKLNLGKDGKITAEINSSKEETHVLLQKNVEVLQKMMSDNGYKSDVSGFSFNFRGSQNGNNGNQEQQRPHHLAGGDFFAADDEENVKENETVYTRRGILA